MVERVFIAGMYKSGTSWLLSALAAHPQVLSIREIDILKAVGVGEVDDYKLKPLAARINHVFGGSAWCGLQKDLHAAGELRRFMLAHELEQTGDAKTLSDLEPSMAISVLGRLLAEKRLRKTAVEETGIASHDKGFPSVKFGEHRATDRNRPISCIHQTAQELQDLFVQVRDADNPFCAAKAFLDTVEKTVRSEQVIVFKAADLLARMSLLDSLQPGIRKIIIVRDGRDSAISASHYRELMHEQRMPWNKQRASVRDVNNLSGTGWVRLYLKLFMRLGHRAKADYFNSLRHWAWRVRKLIDLKSDPHVYVLRYEDLTQDFPVVMKDLLTWLGVSATDQFLDSVAEATSFERMAGRNRGEAAKEVMRKGQTLEWVNTLSLPDKLVAWAIAGRELAWLGYNRFSGIGVFSFKGKKNS